MSEKLLIVTRQKKSASKSKPAKVKKSRKPKKAKLEAVKSLFTEQQIKLLRDFWQAYDTYPDLKAYYDNKVFNRNGGCAHHPGYY